jgi:hypothetical protein
MDGEKEIFPTDESTKQTWHAPEIIKAEISHDTAAFAGSITDGDSGSVF